MKPRLLLVLVVSLVAAVAAPLAHRTPQAARAQDRNAPKTSTDYFALLDMYLKGDQDRAVAGCVHLARGYQPNPDLMSQLPAGTLRAALLLHIEAFWNGAPEEPHVSIVRAALHRMIGLDPAFARSAEIVFVSDLLASVDQLPDNLLFGEPHPEILLLAGSVAERNVAQKMNQRTESLAHLATLGSSRTTTTGMLADAQWHFRAALEADAHLVEARLRLGHVFLLEKQWADARRELEQAKVEASEPFLKYLAALFLGQVEEQEGRYDGATQAYQSALTQYPGALGASLGLGHALEMKGQMDAAWAAVRGSLTAGEEPQPAPWRVYLFAQYWQIERRLAGLRLAVRQ